MMLNMMFELVKYGYYSVTDAGYCSVTASVTFVCNYVNVKCISFDSCW